MSKTTNEKQTEEQRLAAAHAEAEAALAKAWEELAALTEESEETAKDLRMHDRWAKAWRGEDPALRASLMDSAEFLEVDPIALQTKITALVRTLVAQRAALKTASERHEAVKAQETDAYYGLQRFRHRRAVVAMLRAEVELGKAFQTERTIRMDVAGREGLSVGSMANFAHPKFTTFDVGDRQSTVCYRLKEAVSMGFLTGQEAWLPEVNFLTAGSISPELYEADVKSHNVR